MPELPQDYEDLDPYAVLGILKGKDATADEIKKAYRRKALTTHPDKAVDDAQRQEFHEEFQKVAFAYSVLSDEDRRARYDRTGSLEEIESEQSFKDLFSDLCRTELSKEMLEQDKKEYRESGEEKQDILKYYKESKGDMDAIFENVIHTDVVDDEERIRVIIQHAIEAKEVKPYAKFVKETSASRKRRRKAAESEAVEAEVLAEELGLNKAKKANKSGNDEDALAMMIRKRGEDRFNSMISNLEARYSGSKRSKSTTKAKSKA
jgi:DnaJ family protein C protein 9